MKTLKLTGQTPKIQARQQIEQTIVLTLAQELLSAGFLLGVNDSAETTLRHCRDINKIQDALFSTDDDYLLVYEDRDQDDPTNAEYGKCEPADYWIHCVYGNGGWDVIADHNGVDELDRYLGNGSKVQALIDYAADNNTVIGFSH